MKKLLYVGLLLTPTLSYAAPDYLEYYNVSCPSLSEVAGKTMKNWQNNATFKDMLENSTAYSKTLFENSNISLKDAELHTYAMVNEARKERVRDSLPYKEYAVSKFSIDYELICKLKSQSVGVDFISKYNNCRDEERFASGFVYSRQAGVPVDDLLRANQNNYDQRLLTHSHENIRSRNLYESINRTLLDAYSIPLEDSVLMKEKSAVDFGEKYYKDCMSK